VLGKNTGSATPAITVVGVAADSSNNSFDLSLAIKWNGETTDPTTIGTISIVPNPVYLGWAWPSGTQAIVDVDAETTPANIENDNDVTLKFDASAFDATGTTVTSATAGVTYLWSIESGPAPNTNVTGNLTSNKLEIKYDTGQTNNTNLKIGLVISFDPGVGGTGKRDSQKLTWDYKFVDP
jgi:hypothetical protein